MYSARPLRGGRPAPGFARGDCGFLGGWRDDLVDGLLRYWSGGAPPSAFVIDETPRAVGRAGGHLVRTTLARDYFHAEQGGAPLIGAWSRCGRTCPKGERPREQFLNRVRQEGDWRRQRMGMERRPLPAGPLAGLGQRHRIRQLTVAGPPPTKERVVPGHQQ